MPEPFQRSDAFDPDKLTATLEKGSRAQQVLALGVGRDLELRREAIWKQAERELRSGKLTVEAAFTHIACSNALWRYHEELKTDITDAQTAADRLHAEADREPTDGDV